MIRSKVQKGHLEGVLKVQGIWNDKIIEGKVRKMYFSEFEAINKIKHCAFTKLNLAANPGSQSTPWHLIHREGAQYRFESRISHYTKKYRILTGGCHII